jgi:hypothetical protein
LAFSLPTLHPLYACLPHLAIYLHHSPHLGLAPWASLWIPPGCAPLPSLSASLPRVSVCVPGQPESLEACGGGAPPSGSGCCRAPSPAGGRFGKHPPRWRDCAGAGPRPAPRGTMTDQRIRGPSHKHARPAPHTPGPLHPRTAHPGPATAGTRTRANNRRRGLADPLPPATSRHANTPPAPARDRRRQPPPPPPSWTHLAELRVLLGTAPSPPHPRSVPGTLRRDRPGPRRLRAASSLGHPGWGRRMSANRHAPPPGLCPAPLFPPPREPRLI